MKGLPAPRSTRRLFAGGDSAESMAVSPAFSLSVLPSRAHMREPVADHARSNTLTLLDAACDAYISSAALPWSAIDARLQGLLQIEMTQDFDNDVRGVHFASYLPPD